tara:strand:+ start:124 stop:588 length:465 start_codon:yes stop_codon:yes gene_type:complete
MKKKHSLILILILFLNTSCGYKNLANESIKNYNFNEINLSGNKKIGQIIKQELMINSNLDSENKYKLLLDVKTDKEINDKDIRGVIKNYTIGISVTITFKNTNNEVVKKIVSHNLNFDTLDTHSKTLRREKKVIENLSIIISSRILRYFDIYTS